MVLYHYMNATRMVWTLIVGEDTQVFALTGDEDAKIFLLYSFMPAPTQELPCETFLLVFSWNF